MLATAPPAQVHDLLEPLGTGAFVVDVAPGAVLRFVAINRRHAALAGLALEAVAGQPVTAVLPADAAARLEDACRRCAATQAPVEYEERADTPDGARWWETMLVPLAGPHGHVVRVMGTTVDTTRRRRAEQHLDVLLSHAPSAIAYVGGAPAAGPHAAGPHAAGPPPDPGAAGPGAAGPRRLADPLAAALAGQQTWSENEVEAGASGRRRVHSTYVPDRAEGEPVRGVYVVSTDVTDQRRAESALLDTQASLSAVFDAADNPIVLLDAAGTIVAANAAAGRRYGVAAAALTGRPVWALAAPDDRPRIAALVRQAVTGGVQVRYETHTADRYFEEIGSPVLAGDSSVVGIAGYALDVTDRKRAELTLQRRDAILEAVAFVARRFLTSESWRFHAEEVLERLGRAAEADRAYIFVNERDPDGSLVMSQLFEWAAPDTVPLLNNPMLQRLPYRAGGLGRWEKRLAEGEAVLDALEWLPRDASGRLVSDDLVLLGLRSLAVVPLFAGDQWWGFIGFEDVDADRRWEKAEMEALRAAADTLGAAILREQVDVALRRSEARYKLAVEAGPVSIFDWDLTTGRLFLAPQFKQTLGYAEDEIGDRVEDWECLLHADDLAAARARIAALADGRMPHGEVELRFHHRSGEVRWFVVRAAVVGYDDAGRPRLLAGTQTDITERTRAQHALQRRSDALARANDELKSFAYIVSHDLRAPLITIEGFVGELHEAHREIRAALDGAAPGGDAARLAAVRAVVDGNVGKAMDYVAKAAATMGEQIAAILKLSRLGYREMRVQEIDTAAMVAGLIDRLAYPIRARQAVVEVEALPPVLADRDALDLVLGNLLSNAVKYLEPARPGRIAVWAEPGFAEGENEDEDGMTVIHVRDNGRGIDPKDHAKVFEIFRRIGPPREEGEGVGLTFARAAVRRWGGDLWFVSTPDRGSTFSFSVPTAPSAAPQPAADRAS